VLRPDVASPCAPTALQDTPILRILDESSWRRAVTGSSHTPDSDAQPHDCCPFQLTIGRYESFVPDAI
jgi:hypothetical protein